MTEDDYHVKLRDHIKELLVERDKALNLTADNLTHRLDVLNHWREESLKDRERYLEKAVYAEMHSALYGKVEKLENWQSNIVGKVVGFGLACTCLSGLVGALLAHLFSK